MLKEEFGDNAMSRVRVFIWHKGFSEGREEVEDDKRPCRSVTSRTEGNVQKINEIVRKDRRLSIRMIADMVNINKEMVRQILHDELNMTKVCAKLVPKNLTQDQKDNGKNICYDIMERLTEEPDLLTHVITGDETWIFHNALSVKQFLADRHISVLEHPPYSPDFAPCNFHLFPKVKSALKRTHFQSVEEIKAKMAELLKRVTTSDLQHCFEK